MYGHLEPNGQRAKCGRQVSSRGCKARRPFRLLRGKWVCGFGKDGNLGTPNAKRRKFTFFSFFFLVLVICPDIYIYIYTDGGFFKEVFSRSCAADVRKKDVTVIFTPIFGEMIQFDQHIFQMG